MAAGILILIIATSTQKQVTPKFKNITIVTTVAPLTNIVSNIAGPKTNIIGLIPDGIDSNTYEPTPENAKAIAQADIIFVNGLSLEEPTTKLAETNKKTSTRIVQLGENTLQPDEYIFDFSFPEKNNLPNPHLWVNPLYGLRYAEIIKENLINLDPKNSDIYTDRFIKFKTRIGQLDSAIKTSIGTIAENNRKLLTYHDSFAYFANTYGMTMIGAIQPSDFREPNSKEVKDLIQQLRREQVPAIFGSDVFPSKILETISQETGIKYIDTLRDDSLPGSLDDANHTYIGMLVEDVITIVKALGGNPEALRNIDASNI